MICVSHSVVSIGHSLVELLSGMSRLLSEPWCERQEDGAAASAAAASPLTLPVQQPLLRPVPGSRGARFRSRGPGRRRGRRAFPGTVMVFRENSGKFQVLF